MNILLVEPDLVLGEVYQQSLEAQGHQVVWQRTSAEAVQALDVQKADLVVTELQLPVHNGMEFLYELRSYSDWQHIPVIIHSSLPAERVVGGLTYSELDIKQYLYKPTTKLVDLNDAVNATLIA
jgi:DNA-binding response OmpR family regulator